MFPDEWDEAYCIELLARAICHSFRLTTGFKGRDGYTLADEVENAWDHFIPEARAAMDVFKCQQSLQRLFSPGSSPSDRQT